MTVPSFVSGALSRLSQVIIAGVQSFCTKRRASVVVSQKCYIKILAVSIKEAPCCAISIFAMLKVPIKTTFTLFWLVSFSSLSLMAIFSTYKNVIFAHEFCRTNRQSDGLFRRMYALKWKLCTSKVFSLIMCIMQGKWTHFGKYLWSIGQTLKTKKMYLTIILF